MAPTTAAPRDETMTDTAPETRAAELREERRSRRADAEQATREITRLVERLTSATNTLQAAVAGHARADAELEVLAAVHGVETPEADDPETDAAEAALELAADLSAEFGPDRKTRSARTNLAAAREAVRSGDAEDARRRTRRLCGLYSWLDEDTARSRFVEPADRERQKAARDDLRQRALRWAKSEFHGAPIGRLRNRSGDPVRFPEKVTALLEAFAEDPRSWAVPQGWYMGAGSPPAAMAQGDRDLREEVARVVSDLPDEGLEV